MGLRLGQNIKNPKRRYEVVIQEHHERDYFFSLLNKMFCIAEVRELRLIFENPYNGETYLKQVLRKPDVFDKNRMLRGDFMVKPTGFWFINCTPTNGFTLQYDKKQIKVWDKDNTRRGHFAKASKKAGLCSEERSMISPDYARNFICDFILGKEQQIGVGNLFNLNEN